MNVSLLLPLLLAPAVVAQLPGTFTATGNMTAPRSMHTATLLQDGKVLIAGGNGPGPSGNSKDMASAELYDPSTGTFTSTGNMITARRGHTATLLADGRVLIAGGSGEGSSTNRTAEIFDPSTGSFVATGDMIQTRGGHTAVLLVNGKVLIVGGTYGPAIFARAELFDPATGKFSLTGEYAVDPFCDFCSPAVPLVDGSVLYAQQTKAQIYDPASGMFNITGATSHCLTGAASLIGGKILFAGGECDEESRSARAELYDAATHTFAATGNMNFSRVWHTLTLLPDGTVLVAGGETDGCSAGVQCVFAGSVADAELYDPATGVFVATGPMTAPRETHTATLLKDGRVLIAGGTSYGGIGIFFGSTASAELYNPPVSVPGPSLLSVTGNGKGQGAIQHGDTFHLVSPGNPAVAGEVLVLYCTGLADGGLIPPRVAVDGHIAEVLWFGNTPGFVGLNQVNFRVPSAVTQGSNVPVRVNYLGRPSNEVAVAIR